jgi:hypothetical protein
MSSISFTNLGEVLASIEAKKKKLEDIPKLAAQMGVLALNEIHPLTNKKTGNWDSTIHAEVSEVGPHKYELWVGSKGAFTGVSGAISSVKSEGKMTKTFKKNVKKAQKSGEGTGYNYGKRQEDLYHPIEIGYHKAQPAMVDLWNEKMKGIVTANAAGMSDFAGLDVSEW